MIPLLKRFEGVGTGLTTNTYFVARLRLAFLYTLIFGALILIMSGMLYNLFAADIHEDMSSMSTPGSAQEELINYHKKPLRDFVIVFDSALLIFIAVMSYFLAGVTLKPIQENDEAQKRFIAHASHELRTPLAILQADMEIYLQDATFPAFLRPVFSGYLEEVDNMKTIVENMLTLFRFESNQMKLNMQQCAIAELMENNVKSLSSYAQSKGVSLKCVKKCSPTIFVDTFYIQQAFRNIVKNAIEYSKTRGEVTISIEETKSKVKLSIEDTGIGIPKEIVKTIFNRFQRSALSQEKRKEGVGLGLALAKEIVDLHSGTIKIESSEGKGTTVTICLPKRITV